MDRISLLLFLIGMLLPLNVEADDPEIDSQAVCQMIPLQVEQLPDMNSPRAGHSSLYVGDEVMVIGGHTSGFVPLVTAEFFRDGQWQELPMVYTHDNALAILQKSGQVMIMGGHLQDLGIGHIFSVESYDPATRTFSGFGCLDTKRVFAQCLELDSGRVVISGNWYHGDCIEMYDGAKSFTYVKPVVQQRSSPYIFRIAKDDAIVLGVRDTCYHEIESPTSVDRLKGEPFSVPLLQEWKPVYTMHFRAANGSCIGDEENGEYVSLLPVQNSDGQLGVIRIEGTDFQLLPTVGLAPKQGKGGKLICYFTSVIVDREARLGYIVGHDDDLRFYVVAIDYTRNPAPLKVYYTEPLPYIGLSTPVLTPDGDLILAGGCVMDNFNPLAGAYRFLLGHHHVAAPPASATGNWLWILLIALMVLAVVFICLFFLRRHRQEQSDAPSQKTPDVLATDDDLAVENGMETDKPSASDEAMMQRICLLMEEQQMFLVSGLKVSDIAVRLDISSGSVSNLIKVFRGTSFAQFVNGYRIEFAKDLLRKDPSMKISAVAMESGFASEMSFFRSFKNLTGTTPKDWLTKID